MKALVLLLVFAGCRREVPVLLWHEVGCGTKDARDVPAGELDQDLSWLEGHGYHYVTALDAVTPGASLPERPVALTFDDGAACLYGAAFPVLRRHRAPFTLFLPSEWIANDAAGRRKEKLGDGEAVAMLDWPEVDEMLSSGLASLGAHGRTHAYLRRAGEAELENEVGGSRAALAAVAGRTPALFAYPFGAFAGATVDAVRRAGYAGAFAVGAGLGGTFAYRRRSLHRGAGEAGIAAAVGDRWIFPLFNHD